MIPVLSAEKIRQADAHTIAHEPIASINLMERASLACAKRIMDLLTHNVPVTVLAGMGNNGGDGLAIARIIHMGAHPVRVLVPKYKAEGSPDFEVNLKRAQKAGIPVELLEEGAELPELTAGTVVIDALFGTGLQRPISGWLKSWVVALNARPNTVFAVDMPSGLFTEDNIDNDPDAIVQANRTLTLELPKFSLLLADNGRYSGDWQVVPIGLDREYIATLEPEAIMLQAADVAALMPPRKSNSHKGDHGHAWLLAGGQGKMGAALMSAKACLRSGCGTLTIHVPAGQAAVVHGTIPEAMVSCDGFKHLSALPNFVKAAAIGVGPGIGTDEATARMLKVLIQGAPAPLVIDADALNILGQNKTWLAFLPKGTILTPHPKELERLVGSNATNDHERLMQAKELAVRQGIVVVLKGAHTAICAPDGKLFFNGTGNPGMAKGGSGDALTGIITSLRAQGLDPLSSALLGVYAHGMAGDLAAEQLGMDGMLPTDLIEQLPLVWKKLREINQ